MLENPIIEAARCCSTCVWANTKKFNPGEDHAPHYMIAKTERWCVKHQIPTVREAVCESWEIEQKRGGVPAVKRALRQNKRLRAILDFKKRLCVEKAIDWNGYRFSVVDGFVQYSYRNNSILENSWYRVSCKDTQFDKLFKL